jgi:hypothetical protein
MLTLAHKMQGMASALTFLEQYHKDGDEIPNHIDDRVMKPGFHL